MFDIWGQYRAFLATTMTNIIQEGWWFCWDVLWWISSHRKRQKYLFKFSRKVTQCLKNNINIITPFSILFLPSHLIRADFPEPSPPTTNRFAPSSTMAIIAGQEDFDKHPWRAQDAPPCVVSNDNCPLAAASASLPYLSCGDTRESPDGARQRTQARHTNWKQGHPPTSRRTDGEQISLKGSTQCWFWLLVRWP